MTNLNPSKEAPMTTSTSTRTDLIAKSASDYASFAVDAASDAGRAFFAKHLGAGAVGCTLPPEGFAQLVTAATAAGLVVRAQ